MVLETLVFSPFNQLTWLVAHKFFILQSRRESYKSYIIPVGKERFPLPNLLIVIYASFVVVNSDNMKLPTRIWFSGVELQLHSDGMVLGKAETSCTLLYMSL
jgi:hypothetical protein